MPGRWITLHAVILLLGSSWALGGRARWAEEAMALFAWSAALPILWTLKSNWRWHREARIFAATRGRSLPAGPIQGGLYQVWLLVPWVLLGLFLGISLVNPAYEPKDYPAGRGFRWIAHLSYLPSTVSVARTAEKAALLSGLMVLAVAFYHLVERRRDVRLLFIAVFLNGLVLSLLGAMFKLSRAEDILGFIEPVNQLFFASFTYANHWSAFAILGMCVGLGLFEHYQRRQRKEAGSSWRRNPAFSFLTMLFFNGLTIPLSGSRSGMLILFLLMGIVLYRLGTSQPQRNRRGLFSLSLAGWTGIAAAGIVGAGALAFYIAQEPVERRWQKTKNQWRALIVDDELDLRFYASPRDAFKMVMDKPVWGWGLGSFVHGFPKFAGPEFATSEGRIKRMEFAHNDWLQYWAELGTVGFLALLAVPGGLTVRVLRANRNCPPITTWLLIGLLLILILATFEFPLSNAAILAHVFVLSSTALRYPSLPKGR